MSLVLRVAIVAALLLGLFRWVGWREPGPDAGDGAGRAAAPSPDLPAARAGVRPDLSMDLSFYRALGGSRAEPGAPAALLPDGGKGPDRGPEEPPGAGGAFVVQAMATRDEAAARRLRDRLAAHGLPAVLVEGRAGGGAIYRVRVGRYRERRAAEAVARRIHEEHGLVTWVLREAE